VRAASLAVALNRRGFDASSAAGAKSQFDVLLDGELVFSKQHEGRFPEEEEIVDALAPR
jgi:selT/selW/selH-like putative selenoprotein